MFRPTFQEFEILCTQGNLIPVFREHLADMETPVSALSRFMEDDHAFLLESVEGGERWGRYSFIGLHPHAVFTVADNKATFARPGDVRELEPHPDGPFTALRAILDSVRPVRIPGLPRFFAGAVGYLGYETVREFERLPAPKARLAWPTAYFVLTDEMAIFDNVRHTMQVVVCVRPELYATTRAAYSDACARIERIEERLRQPRPVLLPAAAAAAAAVRFESNISRDGFCDRVRQAKRHIVAGDIIQAVLSQRFSTDLPASPLALYRALRLVNPSPYTFFLKFGHRMLVGSSPEVMVRLTGSRAELRPIAGTRPRGSTEQEDRALADALLADEKERAEHLMLVDLGRNDLGRVAVPGSVQVRDFMRIERYSHVMHIVSDVQAILAPGRDAIDLVRATFPAGTLTGAPKIRAMEIIHDLEPEPRGPYGGAVGYIGYDGTMDLAITIRTMQIDGTRVSVQAGAGIVADSDPEREFEETEHKARGMLRALELAASNLELTTIDNVPAADGETA